MSKSKDKMKLMDSSGSEDEQDEPNNGFKINENYAKRYEKWRGAECLQKLKDKHGAQAVEEQNFDSEESSSEDEDSDAEALTEEVEKEFYKTLASLKSKDPKIYDQKTSFFSEEPAMERKKKEKKEEKITLKDMQRKFILEKGGIEDELENAPVNTVNNDPTYVQEVAKVKESFKAVLEDSSEGEDDGDDNDNDKKKESGLFKKREITGQEKDKEDAEYKAWLAGQKTSLSDEGLEKDMSGLRNYWNNKTLDRDEKFLKDYLLNKRYIDPDKEDEDVIPTYQEIVGDIHSSDENLSEDDEELGKQEEFEHKYNFRYEEPDDNFIKRYPRTIKDSMRLKDDKRKKRRKEVEERKKQEKQQKMEELKMLKTIKKKEILEKLEKLKMITGNEVMEMNVEDIDGDFDPAEYDKRMNEIYNNFDDSQVDDEKPTFSDFEDDATYGQELDVENWDGWTGVQGSSRGATGEGGEGYQGGEGEEGYQGGEGEEYYGGEDDFNMDCDYDPAAQMQKELIENTRGRKKSRRKSKFSQVLEDSQNKPVFDPKDKTFEEYYDEYYKLDCEDVIGDMPVRFKYRQVEANDFGLTTDEIILADDRDLNAWCSLKKTCQYRSEYEEKTDVRKFNSFRNDMNLKKKKLPSVYQRPEEGEEKGEDCRLEKLKKKRKKGKKRKLGDDDSDTAADNTPDSFSIQDDLLKLKKAKIDASENCDDKTKAIQTALLGISGQKVSGSDKKNKKAKNAKQQEEKNTNTNNEKIEKASELKKAVFINDGSNKPAKNKTANNSPNKFNKNGQNKSAQSGQNKPANNSPNKFNKNGQNKSAQSGQNKSANSGPNKSANSGPNKSANSGPNKSANSGPNKSANSGPNKSANSGQNKSAYSGPNVAANQGQSRRQEKRKQFKKELLDSGKLKRDKKGNVFKESPSIVTNERIQAYGVNLKKLKRQTFFEKNRDERTQ